jgi:hypothetical protein
MTIAQIAGAATRRRVAHEGEVWHTAIALVTEHGDDAGLFASLRADSLLAQYDVAGHFLWKRIKKAVKELQRRKRTDGEWLN